MNGNSAESLSDGMTSQFQTPRGKAPPLDGGLLDALGEFFSELLGFRSSYGLDDIATSDPGEAEAVIRLRVRIAEQFLDRGWQAPPEELERLERDRALLLESDDETPAPEAVLPQAEFVTNRQDDASADGHERRQNRSPVPAEVEVRQMRQAMQSRAVIEQAKGIAMERYGLPASTAWSWLVRTSQQHNEKLRELAQRIVDSVAHPQDDQQTEEPARRLEDSAHG